MANVKYVGEYEEKVSPAPEGVYWGRRVATLKLEPLAADGDDVYGVLVAPCLIEILSVGVVDVDGGHTHNATNYRTFELTNRGTAGSGTTAVAVGTTITDDITQYVPFALAITPADRIVERGEVLTFSSTHTASGVAQGEGILAVVYRPVKKQ